MGHELDRYGRKCIHIGDDTYKRSERDNPRTHTTAEIVKYAEMVCAEGYTLENEKCHGEFFF